METKKLLRLVLGGLFFSKWLLASSQSAFVSLEQGFENYIVAPVSNLLFFDIAFFTDAIKLPFILVWLIFGALFLTIKMRFINIRSFRHAIDVVRGKYSHKNDPGEISHFQALASALSATVGLGNIAGVALAVSFGGPGAIFWMILAGILGMTSKFSECSLALMYRSVGPDGRVLGGPMLYLTKGLEQKGRKKLGLFLGSLFAVLCIGGSLGGGNMFQANQSYAAISGIFPFFQDKAWVYGLIMSLAVGLVIIGGIKRIGSATGVIVPLMCVLYLLCGLWIIISNYQMLPTALLAIWDGAFSPEAGYGGFIGVLITGFRRAAFSNEAGVGSAAIAHSAASTKEPIREGIVACLEPFIDTVVVCTMTGLIIVITGAYQQTDIKDGVMLTSHAFSSVSPLLPIPLAVAIFLFAFSTMISWSYYGERCWAFLFKTNNTLPYKVLFVFFVFLGSVFSLGAVLEFSDLMILGMCFPNLLGVIFLSTKLKASLDDYWNRYKSGRVTCYDSVDDSSANESIVG